MKAEVPFYEKLDSGEVRCQVCPQNCKIKPDKLGVCSVRANREGSLYALNYGEVSSAAVDPIEKKPLYHFYPGTAILSVGTVGCNLTCGFCQNYNISHGEADTRFVSPKELQKLTLDCRGKGSVGVAYTYSEPMMWYEYIAEAMPLIHEAGYKNVLVTNGYINPEPLERILPYIDAMNIDLKAFTDHFYHANCKGRLEPVKETIQHCVGRTHIELTTLLVTGLNDQPAEISELAQWVASLDDNIPLHLSRYHPAYKFDLPPTPVETLEAAREAALEHLKYVYVGNIEGFDNNTYCRKCGEVLVERTGYSVRVRELSGQECAGCGEKASFINK